MDAIVKWLDGKKTYIGAALLAILAAVQTFDGMLDGEANWLTTEQYLSVELFIAGLTGLAARAAIAKLRK